jgi:hypothetical protein
VTRAVKCATANIPSLEGATGTGLRIGSVNYLANCEGTFYTLAF